MMLSRRRRIMGDGGAMCNVSSLFTTIYTHSHTQREKGFHRRGGSIATAAVVIEWVYERDASSGVIVGQKTPRICLHGVSLLSGRWFTFFAAAGLLPIATMGQKPLLRGKS